MRPARQSGIVSSFFLFTNVPQWDEIDIEFLGKSCTSLQTNYFTNGVGGHEHIISLGFDACAAFHQYTIFRDATSIAWKVDGVEKYRVSGVGLPHSTMKVMANLWTGVGLDGWLGPFTYTGPLRADYDWIEYASGSGSAAAPARAAEASDSNPHRDTRCRRIEKPALFIKRLYDLSVRGVCTPLAHFAPDAGEHLPIQGVDGGSSERQGGRGRDGARRFSSLLITRARASKFAKCRRLRARHRRFLECASPLDRSRPWCRYEASRPHRGRRNPLKYRSSRQACSTPRRRREDRRVRISRKNEIRACQRTLTSANVPIAMC